MNEAVFLKHLKKLYFEEANLAITIRKGKGGDPVNIVLDAVKVVEDFNVRIILLDNDKSKKQMTEARELANKNGVRLIENTPCLEHLFLLILNSKLISGKSLECKRRFELEYINRKQRRDLGEYDKYFAKGALDEKRNDIKILHDIIKVMEGNF